MATYTEATVAISLAQLNGCTHHYLTVGGSKMQTTVANLKKEVAKYGQRILAVDDP
jgi:hypothetical protein